MCGQLRSLPLLLLYVKADISRITGVVCSRTKEESERFHLLSGYSTVWSRSHAAASQKIPFPTPVRRPLAFYGVNMGGQGSQEGTKTWV